MGYMYYICSDEFAAEVVIQKRLRPLLQAVAGTLALIYRRRYVYTLRIHGIHRSCLYYALTLSYTHIRYTFYIHTTLYYRYNVTYTTAWVTSTRGSQFKGIFQKALLPLIWDLGGGGLVGGGTGGVGGGGCGGGDGSVVTVARRGLRVLCTLEPLESWAYTVKYC